MIAKNEFIVQNTAYAKYKDLFECNLALINEVNNVLNIFEQKGIKLDSDFKGVVQTLFTRSVALFASVHYLCNYGFGLEAGILVRALLDNVIELKYLEKENNILCKMFLENQEDYSKALRKKDHSQIKKRAELAKMERHYDKWYKDLSKVVHPNYRGVLPRISESQENLLFDIGPNLNYVKESLLLSQYYFNVLFHYFCKSFELIDKRDLESGEKHLQKLEEMILST